MRDKKTVQAFRQHLSTARELLNAIQDMGLLGLYHIKDHTKI